MSALDDAVRAWARGMYAVEAGAELLIRHGKAIHEDAPWIELHGDRAAVDVDRLVMETGAWSSGERRVVAIAASLLDGRPLDLADAVTSLDRATVELVLAAIAHAAGTHQHSDVVVDQNGRTEIVRWSTLYPWPDAATRTRR